MFGSEVLEVGVGIVLLFLLVSLICTAVQEGLEGMLKWRAADLYRGVRELLSDKDGAGIAKDFYGHPLINSLFKGDYDPAKPRNLPCYIPSANFARAIVDLVADKGGHEAPLSAAGLRKSADKLQNPMVKRAVISALNAGGNDLNKVKAELETWFNGSMDRVSGWYKRRTQLILFLIGLAAAVVLNIDTITIAQRLTMDKALRQAIVAQAEQVQKANAAGTANPPAAKDLQQLTGELRAIGYPIGWMKDNDRWRIYPAPQACKEITAKGCTKLEMGLGDWLQTLLGWLVTALAVMLGAPFWFDILNKFMVIRSTVKPHEKSGEEGSEDRTDKTRRRDRKQPQAKPG